MKKQTLWKRIFGQKSHKKVKAQQAFQEQFDTKLRFRELEPRVVLTASTTYNAVDDSLIISMTDGDTVSIGRDTSGVPGVDGNLIVSGIDADPDGAGTKWTSLGGDSYLFYTTTLSSLVIADTGASDNALLSTVNFQASLAQGTDLSLTSGSTTIDSVDQVNFQVGTDVRVNTMSILNSASNKDDIDVNIDGTLIVDGPLPNSGKLDITNSNSDGKVIDIDTSATATVQADELTLVDSSSGSNLDVNMNLGSIDLNKVSTTGNAVDLVISDVDDIQLGPITANSLTITAVDGITDDASGKIEVSGLASFTATDIDLDGFAAGHSFSLLTLNSSGFSSIKQADAVTFAGSSEIGGALTVDTTGAIGQAIGSSLVANGTADFTAGSGQNVILDLTINEFNGVVSAAGQSGSDAAIVRLYDNDGGFQFGNILAGNLEVTSVGSITQASGGIDVSGDAVFTTLGANEITLKSASNAFGAKVSATGNGGAAGAVTIVDSDGNLTLDDIHAATLSATAINGGIDQTVTGIRVTDTSSFTVQDGKDVLLTTGTTNNAFRGAVSISGASGAAGSVAVFQADKSLELGAIDATYLTIALDKGSISQTGAGIHVSKDAQFSVGHEQNIVLDSSNNVFAGELDLFSGTGTAYEIEVHNSGTNLKLDQVVASGDLTIVTNGGITQTNVKGTDYVQVGGVSSFTVSDGANIELGDNKNNKFDVVNAQGQMGEAGDVLLYDFEGDLTLGNIVAKNLTAENGGGGDILDTTATAIQVSALTNLTGNNVLLNKSTAKHEIIQLTVNATGNVHVVELGGFSFKGSSTISGYLTIETDGGIGQIDGGLVVSGTTNLTVADDAAVTLDAANDFVGAVSIDGVTTNAGMVTLNDTAGGIILGAIDAASLNVTSATNITQTTDGVKVSGVSKFDVSEKGSITLDEDGNEFNEIWASGSGFLAAVAKFKDSDSAANGITLGKIVVGDLQVTTVGEISDTKDEMLFFGIGSFDGGSLDFTNYTGAGHDFNAITLQIDGDAKFNEDSSLASSKGFGFLGDSSVGGQLEVTTTGIVEQFTGSLKVTGATKITTPGAIELDKYANDFQDSITLSGTTVVVYDANEIKLGNVTANSFEVHAKTGDIFQEMGTALDIETTTVARATTGFNVILGNDNDFTGSVSVVGFSNPTDVVLNDVNDLIIADIDSVTLTATAGLSITQQAGTSIKASTSADLTAGTTVTLRDVTTPTLSLTAGDTISQEAGTSLLVSGMTMVEVTEGVNVDLSEVTNELGSISVNASNTMVTPGMEVYAGTVTIYDGGNDNADALPGTDDDGLTLKDIWAATLTVTSAGTDGAIIQETGTAIHADKTGASSASLTAGTTITLGDITTPTLDLKAGNGISQELDTALIVSGMTTVEVGTGENVDLSKTGNNFGSIGVIGTGATEAGEVTIVDADGGIFLKDIIAANLTVTVNDAANTVLIEQEALTSTKVSGTATFINNTGGDIVLNNDDNLINQFGAKTDNGVTRGNVTVRDSDGGIVLSDIVAGDLTVIVTDTMDMVDVTQVANKSLDVSGMTTIEVTEGGNVDLSNTMNKLGSISVNADSKVFAGTVTIYDGGNDNTDLTPNTADDGLTLKDIWASTLIVTSVGTQGAIVQDAGTAIHANKDASSSASLTADTTIMLRSVTTPTFSLTSGGDITQLSDELKVDGMTMVEVAAGVNVDLSQITNELGSISVNHSNDALVDEADWVYAGTVSIYDSGNNDDMNLTATLSDNGLVLKNIWAATLNVTSVGTVGSIAQEMDTAIHANKDASSSASLTADTTIMLRSVTTPTFSLTSGGDITQLSDELKVDGMTMVEVAEGVNVDLSSLTNELGSISVNDSNDALLNEMDWVYAGTVSIYDSGNNDDMNLTVTLSDNGLVLKNIWASTLNVTSVGTVGSIAQEMDTAIHADKTGASSASLTADTTIMLRSVTTPTFSLTSGGDITQLSDELKVDGMTMVEVAEGVNVDLSSETNELGSISVNHSNDALVDEADWVFAGKVEIYDSGNNDDMNLTATLSDNGLVLKNIWAANLTVTTSGSEGDISQMAGTGIYVPGMTMIEVGEAVDVDLTSPLNRLGSISVNESNSTKLSEVDWVYAGKVEIFDGTNDNADGLDKTWDDGLVLKDIWADTLIVTTDGTKGHISQECGAAITAISQVTLDASGRIVLGDITTENLKAEAELEVDASTEVITQVEATGLVDLTSKNSYVRVSDIVADNLSITAHGDISQLKNVPLVKNGMDVRDSLLTISSSTTLHLTANGSITLLNDGDLLDCDEDPANGNDLSAIVELKLDDSKFLENFEILNINKDADIPIGVFNDVIDDGTVNNLTLKYTQVDLVTLPTINITGDLWIQSGAGNSTSDLLGSGSITTGGDATFVSGQIHLGTIGGQNLAISGHATFYARTGDIEVGVASAGIDSVDRGDDSGASVVFDTLTFNAAGHVTISEDAQMTLVNGDIPCCDTDSKVINEAQTAVLTSTTAGIETGVNAEVKIHDLSTFEAVTDINLGNAAGSIVDLRILYIESAKNVSIIETSDFNSATDTETALALMDGTKVTETLAIQTGGHLIQVNDIRANGTGVDIAAENALFVANGSILMTQLNVDVLAAMAGNTDGINDPMDPKSTLRITPNVELNFADAGAKGISNTSGFTTNAKLTTDLIDADLPDLNSDEFAAGGLATGFDDTVGEDYSIVIVDVDKLTIGDVSDSVGSVGNVEGFRTSGSDAGHVFVRTKGGGDLIFDAGAGSNVVVGLANSGVITALAGGDLDIVAGSQLNVSSGANPDTTPFAIVTTIAKFSETFPLPFPNDIFEIDDNPAMDMGPSYTRIQGEVATYYLIPSTAFNPEANVVFTQLGVAGEKDFLIVMDWGDNSDPNPQPFTFTDSFGPDVTLSHIYSSVWLFQNSVVTLPVSAMAYNSPQINLYENVDSGTPENLNVVTDRFNFVFGPIPMTNIPLTEFVRPNNPYVAPFIPPEANPTPYTSLTEITDDTRVATQIDGVTVVEVDPSDFMEKGEKVELDDDFMTLDAVKEYIQNGVQFPVGLYKIEILYPGSKEPEVYFYWKVDRQDPFDLFSHDTKPVAPRVVELAVANQAQAQLSAEEVWAREYDKWFPGVSDQQPMDDLLGPAAEGEAGEMMPSDDDILLERVTTVSLQDIDRMTDRLRAKRSVVRDSLSGAMIGGAALMAAVAAQGRKDDEAPNHHPEEQGAQAEESLDETSLGRLRRRVRQWL